MIDYIAPRQEAQHQQYHVHTTSSTLSTNQEAACTVSSMSSIWVNQPSAEGLEEQLRHLPSGLGYTGLRTRSPGQALLSGTMMSEMGMKDEQLSPTQDSSQQLPGGPVSESTCESTHNSIEESIEAPPEGQPQASSQSIAQHTFPQPPFHTIDAATVCSSSMHTTSWLSLFPENHLSKSDIHAITELCCSRYVMEDSLWHSLHYLYNLERDIVEILI